MPSSEKHAISARKIGILIIAIHFFCAYVLYENFNSISKEEDLRKFEIIYKSSQISNEIYQSRELEQVPLSEEFIVDLNSRTMMSCKGSFHSLAVNCEFEGIQVPNPLLAIVRTDACDPSIPQFLTERSGKILLPYEEIDRFPIFSERRAEDHIICEIQNRGDVFATAPKYWVSFSKDVVLRDGIDRYNISNRPDVNTLEEFVKYAKYARKVEPEILGINLPSGVTIIIVPISIFVLAIMLNHRVCRIDISHEFDEPWILIDASGVLENLISILWRLGLYFAPMTAAIFGAYILV